MLLPGVTRIYAEWDVFGNNTHVKHCPIRDIDQDTVGASIIELRTIVSILVNG
jgi:hypothetical protein